MSRGIDPVHKLSREVCVMTQRCCAGLGWGVWKFHAPQF